MDVSFLGFSNLEDKYVKVSVVGGSVSIGAISDKKEHSNWDLRDYSKPTLT